LQKPQKTLIFAASFLRKKRQKTKRRIGLFYPADTPQVLHPGN
jgi:hypothetical protein